MGVLNRNDMRRIQRLKRERMRLMAVAKRQKKLVEAERKVRSDSARLKAEIRALKSETSRIKGFARASKKLGGKFFSSANKKRFLNAFRKFQDFADKVDKRTDNLIK